ncbi:hypothetical protein ES708_22603 [subsurface metagenome]
MTSSLELQHFAVLTIAYSHTATSVIITITTNNPCHLTCYYTDKAPGRHRTARNQRGLTLPWGAYYCFVAWKEVEQIEAGDTLIHTFEIPDWSYCQTKYHAFRGTVAGELSPSVSALFKHHHPGLIPKIEEQTEYNTIMGISGGGTEGLGQYLIIPDRKVVKVAFPLSKIASPTGDIVFDIRRGIDQSVICSQVWGDAAGLPVFPTIIWVEVEFDDPQTINEVVIMEFVFTGGDASNQVVGNFQDSDVKPGENKVRYRGGDWFQDTLQDAAYRYTYLE